MYDTGIDWDHYDHGPGSEEYKRKMAAEQREYEAKVSAERAATQTQADRVPALETEIKRLVKERDTLAEAAKGRM